jgi:hypothetical protein
MAFLRLSVTDVNQVSCRQLVRLQPEMCDRPKLEDDLAARNQALPPQSARICSYVSLRDLSREAWRLSNRIGVTF